MKKYLYIIIKIIQLTKWLRGGGGEEKLLSLCDSPPPQLNQLKLPTVDMTQNQLHHGRKTSLETEANKIVLIVILLIVVSREILQSILNIRVRKVYFSVSDTGILGKRKSECSYQEPNLRPSDY